MDFLIFFAFLIVVDTYVHLKGCDTVLWKYKTPEEKELQRKIIEGRK